MILSSQTDTNDAHQMLEFYKKQFAVVELVTCGKCGAFLAFECTGGDSMGLAPNELGKYVIPIGDNLLSHRVRLDEAPTGERMVGYQCGAQVPNPVYPNELKKHEEAKAAYDADYNKKLEADKKEYAKNAKRAKKDGVELAAYSAPEYNPPLFNVPEFIDCGNDTRVGDVERGLVPVGAMQTALSPFEKHQIREKLRADRTHKADFKKVGRIKHFESFQVERV